MPLDVDVVDKMDNGNGGAFRTVSFNSKIAAHVVGRFWLLACLCECVLASLNTVNSNASDQHYIFIPSRVEYSTKRIYAENRVKRAAHNRLIAWANMNHVL